MTAFSDMVYAFASREGAGIPLLGSLPLTFGGGNYYFVDGANGKSGATGLDPDNAVSTIKAANDIMRARVDWAATPWGRRDICVIAPGSYEENLTQLAHGVTYLGLGHDTRDAQQGVKIKPEAGSAVAVGGIVNSAFYNIGFETGDGEATSYAFDGGIVNNCLFHNCFFTGPAETATIAACFRATQLVKTTFRAGCWFCNANVGFYIHYAAEGGNTCPYLLIEDFIISACDVAGIYVDGNQVGPHALVRRGDIFSGGITMAKGVDDNAGVLQLSDLRITATDPVEGCRAANGCYGNGVLLVGTGETA